MKNLIFSFATAVLAFTGFTSCAQQEQPQKAKYVFYFITDGTGVNTVQGTEYYLSQKQGVIGRTPLCMTQLPVVGVSATWSASSDVTDSAASGTALASGTKTYNNSIGMATDSVTPLVGLAQKAKDSGWAVGVGSTAPVNHATPAAQFAHQVTRHDYFQIACQMTTAGFDFYGGGSIAMQRGYDRPEVRDSIYNALREAGYTVTFSLEDYEANGRNADKLVMLQGDVPDSYSIPYWIDRKPGQVTIADQVKAELDLLYAKAQKNGTGFFLMNEAGGKVDFACHANDGATAFEEVLACDSCVRIAYDFYLQHPDETLIVITADHETGGLTLGYGPGGYSIHTEVFANQTCSKDESTRHFQALRSATHNKVTWDQVKEQLGKDFGFWQGVGISESEEKELADIYKRSFVGKMANEENLYSSNEPIVALAVRILNNKACMGWTTGGHTAGLVPVYACGVGQELFMGHNDNAQVLLNIAKAMGF
ncbi:MAG: alkaline phosphatase [Bacteroidales bacterium]|nr:alkaline phosphatase [Candidatus Liminaster caballi]